MTRNIFMLLQELPEQYSRTPHFTGMYWRGCHDREPEIILSSVDAKRLARSSCKAPLGARG